MDDPTDIRNYDLRIAAAHDFDIAGPLGASAALEVLSGQRAAAPSGTPLDDAADRGLTGLARARAMAARSEELVANHHDADASAARYDERLQALRRGAELAREINKIVGDGNQ